jgi:hypothetical protein
MFGIFGETMLSEAQSLCKRIQGLRALRNSVLLFAPQLTIYSL